MWRSLTVPESRFVREKMIWQFSTIWYLNFSSPSSFKTDLFKYGKFDILAEYIRMVSLRSQDALRILAEEIRELRDTSYLELKNLTWIKEAWHPGSKISGFKLTSALFCLIIMVGLLGEGSGESLFSGLIVLLITILNLAVSGMDSYLKREEIYRKTDR